MFHFPGLERENIKLKAQGKIPTTACIIFVPNHRIMKVIEDILKHSHSGLRWVVLALLLLAIVNAARSMKSGNYTDKDKKLNLFAMIFVHVQILLGLILYFMSDKVQFMSGWMSSETANGMYRFFGMEHLTGMIFAALVITIGRKKAEKKMKGTRDKHRTILIHYVLALLMIIVFIPWPFRGFGNGWF